MVHRPAQPGEVEEERKQSRFVQILIDILTLVLVAGATYAFFRLTLVRPENQEVNNPEVVNKALEIDVENNDEDDETEEVQEPLDVQDVQDENETVENETPHEEETVNETEEE